MAVSSLRALRLGGTSKQTGEKASPVARKAATRAEARTILRALRGAEAPLFHGTEAPLFHGTEAPLFHGTEAPLFHGTEALLFHGTEALLFDGTAGFGEFFRNLYTRALADFNEWLFFRRLCAEGWSIRST